MNTELIVKYDFSNIIPDKDKILYVIDYMYRVYAHLENLMKEDEDKNKVYASQYKDYKYKNNYKKDFTITLGHNDFKSDVYKSYDEFIIGVNGGKLVNLNKIKIRLNMSFKRGKENDYEDHDNLIELEIKPYDVILSRESNVDDIEVNEVFNTLRSLLGQFDKQETIFNIR